MSLEALSQAASTAFPIFEGEKILRVGKHNDVRKRENFPPVSPLRRASSFGNDRFKDILPSKDLSSILPSVPTLSRQTSHPCYSSQTPKTVDWARMITLEERSYIRDKIKAAYGRKASTYEDLLELTCAIEEEFVFAAAPSRLDYFKSGVQFEKRVSEKQNQIELGFKSPRSLYQAATIESNEDDEISDHAQKREITRSKVPKSVHSSEHNASNIHKMKTYFPENMQKDVISVDFQDRPRK